MKKFTLKDCIKLRNAGNLADTMNCVALVLNDYFDDRYGDGAEMIYFMGDNQDFCAVITEYGVENAVKFANATNFGYVIGGYNIKADNVILMNENNFWDVFEKFSELIEERILYYFKEENFSCVDIKGMFPSLDIKKFLYGEENFTIIKVSTDTKKYSETTADFPTQSEAISWIFAEINKLMTYAKDFKVRINISDNIYIFEDCEKCAKTKFVFSN